MNEVGKRIWNFIDRIAKKVVFTVLGVFKIKITDEQWDSFMQFVKFSLVGVTNFLISYVVYAGFLLAGCHWLIGSVAGFVISVLNSFYWNSRYVFKEEEGAVRSKWCSLVKTFMSYAFSGLILSNFLLFIWNDVFHIYAFWGPLINLVITTPINFVINKLWAFKTEKKEI